MSSVASKSNIIKLKKFIKKTKYLEEKAIGGRAGDKERQYVHSAGAVCWINLVFLSRL